MAKKAYHGGAFFNAIGNDFAALEKSNEIISADVLDAWFDPSPKVISKIKKYLSFSIKTSPPTQCEGLIKTISKIRKVPEANIIVGGGSSDLMFSFFPHILKGVESVLILDPTYGEYAHIFEHVTKNKILRHKLSKEADFKINYNELSEQIERENPSLVMLVNPNSPTGQYWERQNILNLIKNFPKILFVIDETYVDYIDQKLSLEKEAVKNENLVIIKSMSKVYALSGARAGYIVAHGKVINKVSSFIPPWSVSLVAQIAGVEALKDPAYYSKKYKETHELRQGMISELKKIQSVKIYDSIANFFLIELLDEKLKADSIIQKLRKQKIYLRDCASMSTQFKNNFIRVAVKNKATNKIIVDALKKTL
ncbi:MAG: histidinol-phosphate aminotransferase family protein [Candidatus Kerfeldbacteria bacterium]|nr:histidinol-phosphate aminotransferase family protein [Candidatus Kerfeldbacteria bacterium]